MSLYVCTWVSLILAACIGYKLSDLIERRFLLFWPPDRPLIYLIMSDPEFQRLLDGPTDHATTNAERQNENNKRENY